MKLELNLLGTRKERWTALTFNLAHCHCGLPLELFAKNNHWGHLGKGGHQLGRREFVFQLGRRERRQKENENDQSTKTEMKRTIREIPTDRHPDEESRAKLTLPPRRAARQLFCVGGRKREPTTMTGKEKESRTRAGLKNRSCTSMFTMPLYPRFSTSCADRSLLPHPSISIFFSLPATWMVSRKSMISSVCCSPATWGGALSSASVTILPPMWLEVIEEL